MNNLQDLLSTETIISLIENKLEIRTKKTGKNFLIICPFHDDKNPSLSFETTKKFFNCFSCDFKAGNFFTFWSKCKRREWINFRETLGEIHSLIENKEEKDKVEKILSNVSSWYDDRIEKANERKNFASEIIRKAGEIYHNNLRKNNFSQQSSRGREEAINYLKNRGLTWQTIEEFKIGVTKSSRQLFESLVVDKWKHSEIFDSKLVSITNHGKAIDFFLDNQITIPIIDQNGKHINIASRKINNGNNNGGKYIFLNGEEFNKKSSFLYNYNAVREQTNSECYLVEGFFDVISMSQAGIKNCISLLGTSLSKEQLNLLKNLQKTIVVFTDGDKAGIEASINISVMIIEAGIPCLVVSNNQDKDPDEICREGNILEVVSERKAVIEHVVAICGKLSEYEGGIARTTLVNNIQKYCKGIIGRYSVEITDEAFPYCLPTSPEEWRTLREEITGIKEEKKEFKNGEQFKVERSILYYSSIDKDFWKNAKHFSYYFHKHRVIKGIIENFYSSKESEGWNSEQEQIERVNIQKRFPLILDGIKWSEMIEREKLNIHLRNRKWIFNNNLESN